MRALITFACIFTQPSSRQYKNTQRLLGGWQKMKLKAAEEINIPMFVTDGLLLQRKSGQVYKFFSCNE
jgi:hypothetical protein